MERVQKIIAAAGLMSRRKAEEMIAHGKVTVNGKKIRLGDQAERSDLITVNGKLLPQAERFVYVLLNKPKGYVTTVSERFGMKTVMDLIDVRERVYPVGRLDKQSEGLLFLTNDGDLAQRLLHPKFGVAKVYSVRLDKKFEGKDTDRLLKGVRVDGRVVQVEKLRRSKQDIIIQIHEGRKHIVRRLFEELDYYVVKLARVAYGPLRLKGLKPGEWRRLSKEEVKELKEA